MYCRIPLSIDQGLCNMHWEAHANCCRGKRQDVERKYTKAVIAEWRKCKEQEAEEAQRAQEAAKKAKAAEEAARRSARQQEIAAQREERRAAEAAAAAGLAEAAQLAPVDLQAGGWLRVADGCRAAAQGRTHGPSAAARSRPVTAEKKRVLQERNRQLLERRAAAVQAKKEQQSLRAERQAQMAAKVRFGRGRRGSWGGSQQHDMARNGTEELC